MKRFVRAALAAVGLALAARAVAGSGTLVVLNKAEGTVSLLDLSSGKAAATIRVAEVPHDVDVGPDGKRALVCSYGAGPGQEGSTLTLLDLEKRAAGETIDLGTCRRPHGVAFRRDGRTAAVTAEANQALLVVDVD